MEFPKPHHTSTEQQVFKDLRIGEKYKTRCTFQGCIWMKSSREDCKFVGTPADAASHAAKSHLQIHRHQCKICHMKFFDELEVYLHFDSKCPASNWDNDINSRLFSRDEAITHRRVFNTSFEPSTREKHDEWQRSQNEEKRMRNQEPACPNTPGYDDVVEQTLAAAAAAAQMASTSASRSGHRESQRSQRRSRASSREPQVLETSIRSLPIAMRSREGSIEQSYPEGYDPNARPRQFGFIPRDQAGPSSRQVPQDPRLAAQNQRSESRYQSPMDILYPEEPDTVMVEPTPEREADPSLLDPEIPFDFSRPPPPIPANFNKPSPPAAQPSGPTGIDVPGRSAPQVAPQARVDLPRASRSEWTEMKPSTIAPAAPPSAAPTRPVAQPPRSVPAPVNPPGTQPSGPATTGIDTPGRSTCADPPRVSRPEWTESKPSTFAPTAQPPRSVPDLIDPFVRSPPPPAAASPRPVPARADPPRETKRSTIAQPSQASAQSPRPVPPPPANPPRVAEPVRASPAAPQAAQPPRSVPAPSDPPGRSDPARPTPTLSERALARLAGFAPQAAQPESAPRQTGRQITRADFEGPASRTRTKSTEGYTLPVFRQAPPAARRSNIRARSTDGDDARKPGPRAKSRDPSSRAAAFNQADNDVLGVATTDGSGQPVVKRGRGRPRKDQSVGRPDEGARGQTPEAGRVEKPVNRQRGTPSREQSREPEGPSFRRGQTPEPGPSNTPVGRPPRGPSREQSREPEGPSFRRGQTPELPAEGPPRRPPGRPRKTPSREPSVEAQPPRRGPGRPRTMSREPSEDRDTSRERIAGVATAAGMKRTPNYSRDPSRDRASREPSVEASEEVIVAERVGRTGMTTCCIRTPGEFRAGQKRGVSYTRSRSRDSADEGGMRLREMPSTLSSETADSDANRGRPNEPQLQGKPTVKVARGRSRMTAMLEDFAPIPTSVPKPTSSSRPNAAREDRRQRALNRLRVAVENENGGVETSRANGSTSQQEKRSRVRTPEPSVLHAEVPTPPEIGRIGEGPQEKRARHHSPEPPVSATPSQAPPSFPPGISLPSTSKRATSSGDDEDRPAWNGPSTSSASVSNGRRRGSTSSEFEAPPSWNLPSAASASVSNGRRRGSTASDVAPPPHVSSPSTSSSYSHQAPSPAPIAEIPAAPSSSSGFLVGLAACARTALVATGHQTIPNPLASPEDVAPVPEARRMSWEEYGTSLNARRLENLPASTAGSVAPPAAAGSHQNLPTSPPHPGGLQNLQASSRASEAAPTPPGIHQNLPHRQSTGLRHSGHYQPPPERHQLQSFREAQGIQEQAEQTLATSRRRQEAYMQGIHLQAEEAHQTSRRRQSTEREDWYSDRPHRERQESRRWQERDRGAWQGGDYSRRRSRSRNDDDGGGYNHGHGGGGARGQGNYLGRNFDPNFHQRQRDHRDHNGGGGGGYRRY